MRKVSNATFSENIFVDPKVSSMGFWVTGENFISGIAHDFWDSAAGGGFVTTTAKHFEGCGPDAGSRPEAVYADALVAVLADSDIYVRIRALKTLGKMEPATLAQHVDVIVAKLKDRNEHVRKLVFKTLAKLEPATLAPHEAAIVAVLEPGYSVDWDVRRAALATLGVAFLALDPAAIIAKLEDPTHYVRQAALQALGKLDAATLAQHAAEKSLIYYVHRPQISKSEVHESSKYSWARTRRILHGR